MKPLLSYICPMHDKGLPKDARQPHTSLNKVDFDSFVLDKGIFSNIFEKDIRRVYIYKKAERLAKAIHLVAPAFKNSPSLRDRLDRVAIGLVDAAIQPPSIARDELSRELLALSSVLSIARSGGILSTMNAELSGREAHNLLQEVAVYEEPRLFLENAPSLAELVKEAAHSSAPVRRIQTSAPAPRQAPRTAPMSDKGQASSIGHVSDKTSSRRDAILSVLKSKGPSYIKDISTVIRDVSEKTIQRELQALVIEGLITRTGERRWTTYQLAS
jgi:hypothetical protein